MALKDLKGTLQRVMDKNLQDLVRGIRNHKENEAKYIAECIDEIKQELRQDNIAIKANAVNKLNYLQMLGYDISWAAFNIIEVMSSPKFTFKRCGYLAASQSFNENTDVLMLTTNMIRKDLSSSNMYDAGVALTGLACFMTPDLARDLANDIMTLMTSTRPYLRKKAVLLMYKVFLKFPDALRPAFPRLKEKLEDPDPGVQSAVVNVICELARKNPKNYLSLAPLFFKLMTTSTNNWVLIKIIKLFGALTPLEPRLGKKLIEPLTNLIHSTSAMSLLYECINTVIAVLISISSGIPNHNASIQLCVQKLRILIEDSDQNLKYLGLLAMSKILKTHPKSVQSHKDLILQCLDDKDESIRLRALDLIYGMVNKKNLMEIVKKLMVHMDKAEGSYYRDELLAKIIEICSQSNYQFITNFEWYVSVLVELTRMEGTKHGQMIASQMLDVAIRVQAIQPFAVQQMAILLENTHVLTGNSKRNGICEVLYAAAWICGEFSQHLDDPFTTLESMLRPKVTTLPGHIQSIYVQNVVKLYSRLLAAGDGEVVRRASELLQDKLPMFIQSADLEVQERACSILQLVKYIQKMEGEAVTEVSALFAGELNPVAPKAQRKVPLPEGLDLDAWINDPPSESSEDEQTNFRAPFVDTTEKSYQTEGRVEPTESELEAIREQRYQDQLNNPYYVKQTNKPKKPSTLDLSTDTNNVTDIPVSQIDLNVPLHVPGLSTSDKYLQQHRQQTVSSKSHKKRKKKKHNAQSSDEDIPVQHAVSNTFDLPEGVNLSDNEKDDRNRDPADPHAMLDINLDEPLRADERLPVRSHRTISHDILPEPVNKPKKHKKAKKEKKKSKDRHRASEPVQSLLIEEKPESPDPSGPLDSWLTEPINGAKSPADTPPAPRTPQKQALDPLEPNTDLAEALVPKIRLATDAEADDEGTDEKTKKKKKKDKKEHKKRHKKAEYIETEGLSTPSKESVPASLAATPANYKLPPMSGYKKLGENKHVKMQFESRVSIQHRSSVIISILFTNLTELHIKQLEFNVMDSINTKLVRGPGRDNHDSIQVPFTLPPGTENEGQFAFNVENISMPQKLKGTLTYMIQTAEGSTHEKLDFRLNIPCSAFLVGLPCNGDAYTKLLASGELSDKCCQQTSPLDNLDFTVMLAKICFFCHFTVVEQVDHTASLYSRSIQNHHVALLVKLQANNVLSVDGKSSDFTFLSNVIDDVKSLFTQ